MHRIDQGSATSTTQLPGPSRGVRLIARKRERVRALRRDAAQRLRFVSKRRARAVAAERESYGLRVLPMEVGEIFSSKAAEAGW